MLLVSAWAWKVLVTTMRTRRNLLPRFLLTVLPEQRNMQKVRNNYTVQYRSSCRRRCCVHETISHQPSTPYTTNLNSQNQSIGLHVAHQPSPAQIQIQYPGEIMSQASLSDVVGHHSFAGHFIG